MLANPIPISTQYPASVMVTTYGFHPRSEGLTYRMPARETAAGVAALTWLISNMSLMEGVRGTRSLLASISTLGGGGRGGGGGERGERRGGGGERGGEGREGGGGERGREGLTYGVPHYSAVLVVFMVMCVPNLF